MTATNQTSPIRRMDYDAELHLLNEKLHDAFGIRPRDRVLDIGCGAGQTTRDAARTAVRGSALGVDISVRMIERAKRLADAAELRNVAFEQGDAESHPFAPEQFDIGISRFGTMFFADPLAGFTNIARALRPDGRLVMMVWQAQHRNEWSVSIQRVLANGDEHAAPSPGSPNPFSLADPATTERLLGTAGFTAVEHTDVREPVYYGSDVASAFDWVTGFSNVNDMLHRLSPSSAETVRAELTKMLEAHERDDGVWFDSSAWIVSARRR